MNNQVYDNGCCLLGNIHNVLKYLIENDTENENEDLIKDVRELEECGVAIIMINYDNGMGYSIDYWCVNDIVM